MIDICVGTTDDCVFEVNFITHVTIWEDIPDAVGCGFADVGVVSGVDDGVTGTVQGAPETVHGEGEIVTSGGNDTSWWICEVFGSIECHGVGETGCSTSISIILEGDGERVCFDNVGNETAERSSRVRTDGRTSSPDGNGDWVGLLEPILGITVGNEVPVPCAP